MPSFAEMTSVRVYSPVFENFNKLKSKSSKKKFLHVYPISNLNKTFKKKSNMIQLFFKSLFKSLLGEFSDSANYHPPAERLTNLVNLNFWTDDP